MLDKIIANLRCLIYICKNVDAQNYYFFPRPTKCKCTYVLYAPCTLLFYGRPNTRYTHVQYATHTLQYYQGKREHLRSRICQNPMSLKFHICCTYYIICIPRRHLPPSECREKISFKNKNVI